MCNLSLHPQDPGMEFHTRGSQIPEHTLGRDVSWGSDSDPEPWHTTPAVEPLCICSSLTAQHPPLPPGPSAALTSHPKNLPSLRSSVLLCSFWTCFWAHSKLAPPFHQLAPTFSNKEPHLGVLRHSPSSFSSSNVGPLVKHSGVLMTDGCRVTQPLWLWVPCA